MPKQAKIPMKYGDFPPEFKEQLAQWLRGRGPVYHGTTREIDPKYVSKFGFHTGTREAAIDRLLTTLGIYAPDQMDDPRKMGAIRNARLLEMDVPQGGVLPRIVSDNTANFSQNLAKESKLVPYINEVEGKGGLSMVSRKLPPGERFSSMREVPNVKVQQWMRNRLRGLPLAALIAGILETAVLSGSKEESA